jgi:hypothetical protein
MKMKGTNLSMKKKLDIIQNSQQLFQKAENNG